VRRRQAAAVLVVAVTATAGLVALLRGGGAPPVPLKRLVGQTVVGRMGAAGPSGELLRRVRSGALGGVVAFPASAAKLRRDVRRLRAAARAGDLPPPLVAIDQEGGPVKRLPGPPHRSPHRLGAAGSAATAQEEGARTGRYLRGLGVNVDLAPVLDVPARGNPRSLSARAFSRSPDTVAEVGTAWARGVDDSGVGATAKHFPGLGLAKANTDLAPVRVKASRAELDPGLRPFGSAIAAGVPIVMVSTATYDAFGPAQPAAWSPGVISELRNGLGFDGAVATDDLEARSVRRSIGPAAAAAAAVDAGADLVLLAGTGGGSARAYSRILAAARSGRIERSRLEDAYDRVVALKNSLAD
jgi:beta-N-acetylhexosaminidase